MPSSPSYTGSRCPYRPSLVAFSLHNHASATQRGQPTIDGVNPLFLEIYLSPPFFFSSLSRHKSTFVSSVPVDALDLFSRSHSINPLSPSCLRSIHGGHACGGHGCCGWNLEFMVVDWNGQNLGVVAVGCCGFCGRRLLWLESRSRGHGLPWLL